MTDPIAKLHSPGGTLISLFVNRRPPATRAALVDLCKVLPAEVNGRSMRADRERILGTVDRIDSDTAPAVAIFASEQDGIFEFLPLTDRVEEMVTVGPRPYLRPLRAVPRPMRVGVLVADSSRARTYLVSGGTLTDLGDELTVDRGKDNYGGFAGYEEQRIRSRAEEQSIQLWRQAGRRLLEAHQDHPLELVVLAGHDEMFDGMHSQLHSYLRSVDQARIVVDPHTLTRAELLEAVEREVDEARQRRAQELVEQLVGDVEAGNSAVAGLAPVLEACNAHAVELLVVSGPFAKPGVLCDNCGYLARTGAQCPVCGQATFLLDDVVSAAMDATVEAGGRVEVVSVASRLDAFGVGARLRFPI